MGPLSGIRVLDVTRVMAGPYCTMLLGFLGAEVIKVEDPAGGDPARAASLYFDRGLSAFFISGNAAKKSVTLNLKAPRGRDVLLALARRCDVFVENFRPGVAEKLGIGPATLRQANPRLVTCSISGYGSWGPYRDYPAFDLTVQAMAGTMSFTGEPGRPPAKMGVPIGDLGGGAFGAYGIVAALYDRERTGRGTHVDVAMFDVQLSLLNYHAQYYLTSGVNPEPVGSAHPNTVPYQAFRTRDGYLAVAILGAERFWPRFCEAIGLPELGRDPRFATNGQRVEQKAVLVPMLEARLAERTSEAWMQVLTKAEVPCAPVNRVAEALASPQTAARDMLRQVLHPAGDGTMTVVGNPVKVAGHEGAPIGPPPLLGQHTDEVLRDLLGYDAAAIADLRASDAV
ncbi:MAG TPA: CaiB/BaiF CoA-transferase family protein [Candidatus Methylomirabilis sp.]|jgi:crotonobetainyl-CoA:carnitine CoA-transferase CaiB-like acyl-CoA transferase